MEPAGREIGVIWTVCRTEYMTIQLTHLTQCIPLAIVNQSPEALNGVYCRTHSHPVAKQIPSTGSDYQSDVQTLLIARKLENVDVIIRHSVQRRRADEQQKMSPRVSIAKASTAMNRGVQHIPVAAPQRLRIRERYSRTGWKSQHELDSSLQGLRLLLLAKA